MTNGLTDEAIAAFAADLLDLEASIEQGQDDKKAVYASIREAYGKRAADSLKLAVKRHRMDADKRTEADEIDAEAERFLSVIRAPRATRVEIIEEFDAETGEILDNSSTAALKEVPGSLPVIETHPRKSEKGDGYPLKNSERPLDTEEGSPQSQVAGAQAGTQAPPVETHPQHEAEEAGEDVVTAASSPDTHPEPETLPPVVSAPGDESAVLPSAALVVAADRSKPHPWCKDPEECGVEASWNHMCLSCHRRMEKALTERASSVLQ